MRKFALTLVVLFVASLTAGAIQNNTQKDVQVGEKGELQNLLLLRSDFADMENCGKYFRYGPSSDSQHVGVLFLVANVIKSDGTRSTTMVPWGTDKFQTREVKGLKTPVMEVLRVGGPIYPWVEIQISPEDRKLAPCLSKVKSVK